MASELENFDALELATIPEVNLLRQNNYEPVAKLGRGSYATVIKVKHLITGTHYACKIMKHNAFRRFPAKPKRPGGGDNWRHTVLDDPPEKAIQREIDILKAAKGHQNIMNLEEVIKGKSTTFLICELAERGHLVVDTPWEEDTVRKRFGELVGAVGHLHSRNVAHLDIKPDNLLLRSDGQFMIADFGVSHLSKFSTQAVPGGTPAFTAPEAMKVVDGTAWDAGQAFLLDSWACGVVLYYMLHAKLPWNGSDENELWEAIQAGPPCARKDLSPEAHDMLSSLLTNLPEDRIAMEDAAKHPWLQG